MTKGQRAMAVAMIYPQPVRGRGNKDPAKETEKVSFSRIKVARNLLQSAPDLADGVLAGSVPLNDAYQTGRGHGARADENDGERQPPTLSAPMGRAGRGGDMTVK